MSTALQIETQELPALFELSKHLVDSGFLPEHIKKPGQAVAIILAGRELGMPPMRALRALTMVKGKVVESADSQLARFKAEGGSATFQRLDDEFAVLELKHPNGDTHVEQFSMADAKRAGLTANQTWTKYPKAMLRSRVITAGLKSIGWDGAVGNYDPDEAREIGPVAAPEPKIQMPRRLSEARLSVGVAAPLSPDLATGEAEVVETSAASAVDPEHEDTIETALKASIAVSEAAEQGVIDEGQRRRLFALMREGGHSKEDVSAWLLREHGISSSKNIPVGRYATIAERLKSQEPLNG